MCYREGVEVKFILKIKQNFMDNPIMTLSGNDIKYQEGLGVGDAAGEAEEDEEFEDNYMKLMKHKENIDEVFEKQTKLDSLYIKELMIYKIDD